MDKYNTAQEPIKLLQLTSLRFFAALAVVFSHLGFLRINENPIKPIADTIFREGYSGVSFFFVLSGFILCHTYQKLLSQNIISSKKYIFLRLSRIYPLHFLTALPFITYLIYKQTPSSITSIGLNILLLQSWLPVSKQYFSLNAVSWSLSVELFFYMSFIFLAKFQTKTLIIIASTWLMLIGIAATIMICSGNGKWIENTGLTNSFWLFYINPVARLLDFIVGVLICRLVFVKEKIDSVSFNEIASVLLLIIGMYIFPTYNFPEILRAQLLYLPLMSYVIYSFSSGTGLISKFLKQKSIVLLGEASFSLYMIHQPIITYAYLFYLKTRPPLSLVTFSMLLTVFCVLSSLITFKLVEEPIHKYLKKKVSALSY